MNTPEDDLERAKRSSHNRHIILVLGMLALVVLGVAGILLLTNDGNEEAVVGTDPGSVTTAPTTTPPTTITTAPTSTTPATTEPVVVPPTSPATTPPTSPPTSPAPAVPTVWVGQKLAGWYEGGAFVPHTFGSELPAALVGASIAVVALDGSTHQATVTDENCSEPYLSPSPEVWDLRFTAGAPVVGELTEPSDHPAELVAALEAIGVSQASSRSYAVPDGGDGTSDRLVLADGWNADFQYPTWVATWDAETGETSKLEGDLDPSQALDIGNPIEAFYDLDGNGAWETVYGAGDGWIVQDLDTGESLVFGDAHPCPGP